ERSSLLPLVWGTEARASIISSESLGYIDELPESGAQTRRKAPVRRKGSSPQLRPPRPAPQPPHIPTRFAARSRRFPAAAAAAERRRRADYFCRGGGAARAAFSPREPPR